MKKVLLVVLMVLLVPCAGMGEEDYTWLTVSRTKGVGLMESAYLLVNDDVSGGCWTNIQAVKDRIRYRLESEGISVSQEEFLITTPKNPIIVFSVFGDRFVGRCGASYRLEVLVPAASSSWGTGSKVNVAIRGLMPLWVNSGRLTSAVDAKANGQLINSADSLMDSLLADVLSSRKDKMVVNAKKQCFKEFHPMTFREYEEKLKAHQSKLNNKSKK